MANNTCAIEGCEAIVLARGWCRMHYMRWQRHGDPAIGARQKYSKPACSIDGCDRPHAAHGWCRMHYYRWREHGNPLTNLAPSRGLPEAERFWSKVHLTTPGEGMASLQVCWLWQGACTQAGYGTFHAAGGRHGPAHRWAYKSLVGKIPDGWELDHLCKRRACVNPWHLEPVSPAVNHYRARRAKVDYELLHKLEGTTCANGHPWTVETLMSPRSGWKQCRTCQNDSNRRAYRAKRALTGESI